MRIIRGFLNENTVLLLGTLERDSVIRFEPGRQGTGYLRARVPAQVVGVLQTRSREEFPRTDFELGHDCYLVKYPEGSSIPVHVDEAPLGFEHYRLNAVVQKPLEGGQLLVEDKAIQLDVGDAYVFRPDIERHQVERIVRGERLLWSVGMLGVFDVFKEGKGS